MSTALTPVQQIGNDFSFFTERMLRKVHENSQVALYLRQHSKYGRLQLRISPPVGALSYGGKILPVHLAPGCPVTCWESRGRLYTRQRKDSDDPSGVWAAKDPNDASQASLPRSLFYRTTGDGLNQVVDSGYEDGAQHVIPTQDGASIVLTQLVLDGSGHLVQDSTRVKNGEPYVPSCSYFLYENVAISYAAIVCAAIVPDAHIGSWKSWHVGVRYNTGLLSTSNTPLVYPPVSQAPAAPPGQPKSFWSVVSDHDHALSHRKLSIYRRHFPGHTL